VSDYRALADGYFERKPRYDRLAKISAGILEVRLTEAGVRHTVQFRLKEFASFVRKALAKNTGDPFREIHDLAGVRVVVPFFGDRARVADVVHRHFDVRDEEDTSLRQQVDQFGYRGWHFAIALKESDLPANGELGDHVAELQVQTRAESAWAEAGHDLVYKPRAPVPAATERRIARLMAIVELFDEQMGTTQTELLAVSGFQEAGMLAGLEQVFLPLARQDFNRQLSLEVLGAIRSLYSAEQLLGFEARMRTFANGQQAFLAELYRRYRDDQRRNVLLFQPEAIAILDLLERDSIALIEVWDRTLPPDLLDNLARALGHPLDAYRDGTR
jgi:ppGpp synthetase/RelA/SpoT-type nucleotidyltranferase